MTSVGYILNHVATQSASVSGGPTATHTILYLSYETLGSILTGCGVATVTHRITYMSHKSHGFIPTGCVGYLKEPTQ